MVTYTIIVIIIAALSIDTNKYEPTSSKIVWAVMLMPIFGRVLGWW